MATINQLSALDSLQGGDNLAVYDVSNGDARKSSLTLLAEWIQGQLSFPSFTTQYNSPSATGFSVQITDDSSNTHLILTPLTTYASGTIVLPSSTVVIDKQEVLINITNVVTTFLVDGNGSGVINAPTTISANDYFTLKYDTVGKNWYRVG